MQDLRSKLARSLSIRGVALEGLRSYAEAVRKHNKAIGIWTELVEHETLTELVKQFAGGLNNRGCTLYWQRSLTEAVRDFDKAIKIRTELVERHGHGDLAKDLTKCVNNRRKAIDDQDRSRAGHA